MAHIGYIRISTSGQNSGQKFGQLEEVKLDKVFEETINATATKRPILIECMDYLSKGDTLHVQSLDRIARNLGDLQHIVNYLKAKCVAVHFHTEDLIFTENASLSASQLSSAQQDLFKILEVFAQFEKNLMRERQQEGIEKAKKEGRLLGRPRKLSLDDRKDIHKKLKDGKSPATLAEEYGVSMSSIYKIQKQRTGVSLLD